MFRPSYLVCALCVAAMCLVVVGCGSSKVTAENFSKIKVGMSEAEVADILGSPDDSKTEKMVFLGEVKVSTWRSGESRIDIGFQKGKVKTLNGKFKE